MRAIEYTERGAAEQVLKQADLPIPEPAAGEVRVRIMISAVNPSDTKSRMIRPGDTAMPFPAVTPHQDGAGVIDAVGAGVGRDRIGQRVWVYMAQRGRARGTAAEYTTVPAERAVPLPEPASFAEGACLGIPAMTAHYCLLADGPIAGKTVLIQGAAGAVGFYAVQIAKWAGARPVIAVVSREEQAAQARLAGADFIVNRKSEDTVAAIRAAAPDGVDRIVEVAFAANQAVDLAVLARNGVIAAYASDTDPKPAVDFRALMTRNATVRFVLIYEAPQSARNAAAGDINAMIEAGKMHHQIAAVRPLDQVVTAHQLMESGTIVGKLLLDVTI